MTTMVLHLVEDLVVGGTSRVMQNLAALASPEIIVPVLAGLRGDETFVDYLRKEGIRSGIVGENISGLAALLGGANRFAVLVHRSGEETPLWNHVLPTLANEGAVVILELSVFGYPDRGPASVAVDIVFCNSLHTLWRHWRALGQPSVGEYLRRHRVLYNPVVLDPTAEELTSARAREREALGIPLDAFVIGDVCRPAPERLDFMMAAVMPRVCRQIHDAYFVARRFPEPAADWIKRRLGDRFRNLPLVTDQSELGRTYAMIDVFAHMSTMGESFGMSIAEAMRCGVPVISSETPGRTRSNAQIEIVDHGKTGFLANDPHSVVRRLAELANSSELRAKLGEAGKAVFRRPPYAPKSVIRQLESEIVLCARAKGWAIPDTPEPEERSPSNGELCAYLTNYASRATVPPLAKSWRDVPWNLAVNAERLAWRVTRKLL